MVNVPLAAGAFSALLIQRSAFAHSGTVLEDVTLFFSIGAFLPGVWAARRSGARWRAAALRGWAVVSVRL